MDQNKITKSKSAYVLIPKSKSNKTSVSSEKSGSTISIDKISCLKKYWKWIFFGCVLLILTFAILLGVWICRNETNDMSHEDCNFIDTINDVNATNFEESPWLARIVINNGTHEIYGCAGSIIKDDAILTASHCFQEKIVEIHIGGTSAIDYTDMIIIPKNELVIIKNPEFEMFNYDNIADIGIIKLKKPLTFSKNIYPICLPTARSEIPKNLTMNVWTTNQINNTDNSEIKVNLVGSEECHDIYLAKGGERDLKFYKDGVKDQIIFCADSDYVPKGNSGGAVTARKGNKAIAYGILSMGSSKNFSLPSVFVDIRVHLDWISNLIKKKSLKFKFFGYEKHLQVNQIA
ncbi:hypothetical protein ACKWTF_012665 [Chironomus riparius]